MFDTNTLVSFRIDPTCLAAIGGMMLSECSDEDLASEFSAQTVSQMVNEGCDPADVMESKIGSLADITFQVPLVVVLAVSGVMIRIADGPHAHSVALVMNSWKPALMEVVKMLKPESHPFDRFGNCMN